VYETVPERKADRFNVGLPDPSPKRRAAKLSEQVVAAGHGATNARSRRRPISIGTPPLLIAGDHLRPPHTSTASTSAGAKMRLLDCLPALCKALFLMTFLMSFAGAR
jgi:hypothetical protein